MRLRGPEDSRSAEVLRYHLRVAENSRPPVAIRIVRPYESEDELLEHELETLGKTSVVLIGAHPRPTGVILRFEVTLASGATVLRGEGRVLAHKENAFRGQPGLTLRFTRLDPKSKSVVDRATAMRESRSQGDGASGSPSRPAPRVEGALAEALTASTPAPGPTSDDASGGANPNADQEAAVANARANAREKANATARANAKRTGSAKPMALTPPPVPVAHEPEEQRAEEHAEHEVHELRAEHDTNVTHEHVDDVHVDQDTSPAHEDVASEDQATPAPTPVTSIPGVVTETIRPSAPSAAPPPDVESPPPPPVVASSPSAPPPVMTSAPAPAPAPSPSPAAESPGTADPPPLPPATSLQTPADRTDLLARLRERAGKLAPERIQAILAARR